MSNEYLYKEYELSYKQLQFYDTRQSDILKYLFTLTSAVATAQFAVYKIILGFTQGFLACQAFLSIVVFVATLLLFMAMLENRLYFFYMARQLNAIRGYLMQTEAGDFHNNQLYTSTDFPALKPSSVHSFQLLGAALLSSLFAGLSVYALYPALGRQANALVSCIVFILVASAEILGGMKYLALSGRKTADQAIHGRRR
jgi:hypothetical protein